MKKINCLFCDKKINDNLLDETKNFILIANLYPSSPEHVMIISKDHYGCFAELPDKLFKEYDSLKRKVQNKYRKSSIAVEHGIHGQSVNHAHTHFFPSITDLYDFSHKKMVNFVPEEIKITEIKQTSDLKEIFKQEGQYVSIEEDGVFYVLHTKNYGGIFKSFRQVIAKVTGLNHLLDWKTLTEEQKKQGKKWIKRTIEKWKK